MLRTRITNIRDPEIESKLSSQVGQGVPTPRPRFFLLCLFLLATSLSHKFDFFNLHKVNFMTTIQWAYCRLDPAGLSAPAQGVLDISQ
jgi:hypothetical protein